MMEEINPVYVRKHASILASKRLELTAGKMAVEVSGEGNSTETTITVEGSQFSFTDFKQIDDGFRLTILGEWEMMDFVYALNQITEIVSKHDTH